MDTKITHKEAESSFCASCLKKNICPHKEETGIQEHIVKRMSETVSNLKVTYECNGYEKENPWFI